MLVCPGSWKYPKGHMIFSPSTQVAALWSKWTIDSREPALWSLMGKGRYSIYTFVDQFHFHLFHRFKSQYTPGLSISLVSFYGRSHSILIPSHFFPLRFSRSIFILHPLPFHLDPPFPTPWLSPPFFSSLCPFWIPSLHRYTCSPTSFGG